MLSHLQNVFTRDSNSNSNSKSKSKLTDVKKVLIEFDKGTIKEPGETSVKFFHKYYPKDSYDEYERQFSFPTAGILITKLEGEKPYHLSMASNAFSGEYTLEQVAIYICKFMKFLDFNYNVSFDRLVVYSAEGDKSYLKNEYDGFNGNKKSINRTVFNYGTDKFEEVEISVNTPDAEIDLNFVKVLMGKPVKGLHGQGGGKKTKKQQQNGKWIATGGTITDKNGVKRSVYQNNKKAGSFIKTFVTLNGVKTAQFQRVKK